MSEELRSSEGPRPELLSALSGAPSGSAQEAVNRTRRVISTSLGVLREQQAGRKRHRSLALAAAVLVVLLLGPLVWSLLDNFLEEDWQPAQVLQMGIVVLFLAGAVLGSAVLAGWVRRKP